MPTPSQRMAEIRERLSKATRGPWTVSEKLSGSENHRGFGIRCRFPVALRHSATWELATCQPGDEDGRQGRANAHFIAHAPSDLVYLLARCEALESALKRAGQIAISRHTYSDMAQLGRILDKAMTDIAEIARAALERTP